MQPDIQLLKLLDRSAEHDSNKPFHDPQPRRTPHWWEDAACRTEDADLFFPNIGTARGQARKVEQRAKTVCARCPVRVNCLEAALAADEPYGVWGGYSARERRRWFGQRQLDQHGEDN